MRTDTPIGIAWLPATSIARSLRWLPAPTEGMHLPILVDGPAGGPMAVTPWHVAAGIALGFGEEANGLPMAELRPYMVRVLETLQRKLGVASLEDLLLDTATAMRASLAPGRSETALRTARAILPGGARIASDLLAELWGRADRASDPARRALFEEMVAVAEPIRPQGLSPEVRAQVAAIRCVALCGAGRVEDGERFLAEHGGEIGDCDLRKRLAEMLRARAVDFARIAL